MSVNPPARARRVHSRASFTSPRNARRCSAKRSNSSEEAAERSRKRPRSAARARRRSLRFGFLYRGRRGGVSPVAAGGVGSVVLSIGRLSFRPCAVLCGLVRFLRRPWPLPVAPGILPDAPRGVNFNLPRTEERADSARPVPPAWLSSRRGYRLSFFLRRRFAAPKVAGSPCPSREAWRRRGGLRGGVIRPAPRREPSCQDRMRAAIAGLARRLVRRGRRLALRRSHQQRRARP